MKYKILLLIIFLLSIYLRLDAYLINNSFFTDEILLAENIFERNYLGLFFPLRYFQSAPVIFLIISKFISTHIGITELTLRFLPFICSVTSLFVFYKVADVVFETKFAKLASLLTFGINYQLLFYTQCFKQYSSDVLCGLLILYFSLTLPKLTKQQYLLLGLGFSILFLSSYPAIFFIGAFAISRLIFIKDYSYKFLYCLIFPIINVLLCAYINLQQTAHKEYLLNYWHKGFQIFNSEIWIINFQFLFYDYKFPILLLILTTAGVYYLYRKNKFYFFNICSVILITLMAAVLKIYPFERRLALFILPVFIILSLYPLDKFKKLKDISTCFLIFGAVFFITGWINFSKDFVTSKISYIRQDVKPLLSQIDPNDKLYLYYGSIWTYDYYARIKQLPIKNIILPSDFNENNSDKILEQDLAQLPSGKYQLLFVKGTHTYDKDMLVLNEYLTQHKPIKDISLKQCRLVIIEK